METIKIKGKDYLIDIEKCKEQGLLKEKDYKPRSWEEWRQRLNSEGVIVCTEDGDREMETAITNNWWCQLTEQRARELAAFGKLLQLHDAWIGDWKPNWNEDRFCICCYDNEIVYHSCRYKNYPLSFSTKEMCDDFFKTFKDLIEEAKELI